MDDKVNIGKNAWKGWRNLRVLRIVDEGNGIKSFYLYPANNEPLAWYQPGQFLTVRLPTGDVRSWSISDWPGHKQPEYYRLSIKEAGKASSWMCNDCSTDTILSIRSPAGRFVLDWSQPVSPRQVYFSAGIGITPILAMIKAQNSHSNMSETPGVWIHIAKDGSNLQLNQDLLQIENNPVKRFLFLTRPRNIDVIGRDYDFQGRPNLEVLTKLLGSPYMVNPLGAGEVARPPTFSSVYICGPSEFEEGTKAHLQSLGIPPPFIHSENFSRTGNVLGDFKKASVRFTKSKKVTSWEKDKPMSLLELAESIGLTPDFGCRAGACGSCAAKLTGGSVSGYQT
ncbi:hypothetical protein FOFC_12054 [Fusarium oxysporum]|nr:Flavohemoprotein [Fusarium oxysporum f. sp. conglutinans]KAI8409102.1 hypothetical protein FOFC_12054 [Fusarium oxysporum]